MKKLERFVEGLGKLSDSGRWNRYAIYLNLIWLSKCSESGQFALSHFLISKTTLARGIASPQPIVFEQSEEGDLSLMSHDSSRDINLKLGEKRRAGSLNQAEECGF